MFHPILVSHNLVGPLCVGPTTWQRKTHLTLTGMPCQLFIRKGDGSGLCIGWCTQPILLQSLIHTKKNEKQATPKGVCQPKSNRVNSYDLCDINPVTRQHICWTKRVLPFPNGCTQSPVKPVLPHSAVSTTYGSNVYPARKKKKLKTFFLLKIKSLQQFYIAQHKALTSTHQSLKLSIYPI